MNLIKKAFLILVGIIVSIIPLLIFIGTWCLLHPITFWQKVFLFVFGSIILAPLQLWCIVLGICIIVLLYESKKESIPTYSFDNRVEKY